MMPRPILLPQRGPIPNAGTPAIRRWRQRITSSPHIPRGSRRGRIRWQNYFVTAIGLRRQRPSLHWSEPSAKSVRIRMTVMVRTHQPGQAVFRSVLPEDIDWEPFDGDKLQAYPPGSVVVLPGDTWHFHWAKSGEYVTQVTAIGPLGLEYLDPGDDPREQDRQ